MKFYYNGQLVRTSKTHTYTHAVIDGNGKARACASSFELAQKALARELNIPTHNNRFYLATLEALKQGKEFFYYGSKKFKVRYKKEDLEEWIAWFENFKKGLKIVELEQRA
ncbi:MAG: hypothetical protein IJE92_05940 [Clostridia bacterium]|nr:hypothetical protein [Clostridia bacterium]